MNDFFPLKVVEERDDALTPPTAVIIHAGTNDLERLLPNPWILRDVIQEHISLVRLVRETYPRAKIIVSDILDRTDE